MLPAAKWVIGAALVTPVAIASIGTAPVVAGPGDIASTSASATASSTESAPPTETPSETPSTPSETPTTASPEVSTPAPVETTPSVPEISPELAMESQLSALGLPTGELIDGMITPGTKRGMCVFRDLHGMKSSRKLPSAALMNRITTTTALPKLPARLNGVKALVNLTCQAAYITDGNGSILRVLSVSTGKDNGFHATRTGFKRVYYKVNRWQKSTIFPEPDGRPGLYRPIYFDRGIAFHGVRREIKTFPQSHGCVRTWPTDQDWLWNQLNLRDRVFVYGNYWKGKSASLGGYGQPKV